MRGDRLNFVSVICAIVTLLMAALHLSLVLGAPIGEFVLGGKVRIIPIKQRWINLFFVIIFGFLGLLYLGKGGIISFILSNMTTKIIMGIYTAFLAYAIIGNIFFTKSTKEKYVMIPASIIGFISSLLTIIIV